MNFKYFKKFNPSIVLALTFGISLSANSFVVIGNGATDYRWQMPMKIKMIPGHCGVDDEVLESAIQNAVNLWNSAKNSNVDIAYEGHSDASIEEFFVERSVITPVHIFCDPDFAEHAAAATTGQQDAVAVGVPGSLGSGQREDGMVLLEPNSIANLSQNTVNFIVAHELGHVLGLGHSTATGSVMKSGASATENFKLSQDDIDALTSIYPLSASFDDLFSCTADANAGTTKRRGVKVDGGFLILLVCLIYFSARRKRQIPS